MSLIRDPFTAGPSENYWKLLSEERRKALEETLNENQILHQKCTLLEAENETLKQALQEATEVINVLNVSFNYSNIVNVLDWLQIILKKFKRPMKLIKYVNGWKYGI